MLIQFIAKEEQISISEKELTDGMINYSSQYPGQEKQILEYFKKNSTGKEPLTPNDGKNYWGSSS